jgi:hypothetical protein
MWSKVHQERVKQCLKEVKGLRPENWMKDGDLVSRRESLGVYGDSLSHCLGFKKPQLEAREGLKPGQGKWDSRENKIEISPGDLKANHPREAVKAYTHELYHAYEDSVLAGMNGCDSRQQAWKWNLESGYQKPPEGSDPGGLSPESLRHFREYTAYAEQPVEDDAWGIEKSVEEFYQT